VDQSLENFIFHTENPFAKALMYGFDVCMGLLLHDGCDESPMLGRTNNTDSSSFWEWW
jgi:hypothetical protein